jgi:Mrp family chromosome partitioning ATPase
VKAPAADFAGPAAFVARHSRRDGFRRFLFTSARGGEGTTTTVLGIARALVSSYGMRVLAVELNPRSGGFQARLGLEEPTPTYAGDPRPNVENVARRLGLLSIHGKEEGREGGADSAALLGRALESTTDGYDVVLVDAPPVLDRPEALAAAPLVAGVILIVEAGRTRAEMLGQIRDVLDRERVKLLGSVLTKQQHAIPGWIYRRLFP